MKADNLKLWLSKSLSIYQPPIQNEAEFLKQLCSALASYYSWHKK